VTDLIAEDPIPPGLAEAAEEVRAYLVALRGGAPFLSGADGRLLIEWLEGGVTVPVILAALDRAAERRRKRKAHARLSLNACRGEVKKASAHALPTPSPAAGPRAWPALDGLAAEIRAMPVDPSLEAARATLAAVLSGLAQGRDAEGAALPADPSGERVARLAIAACRSFQEAAWEAGAESLRAAQLAAALAQLAGLKDVLSESALAAAAEEVARDAVRGRTPLVSARVVWDRLVGGG